MSQSPVVAYDGDIAGYKATKPAEGAKIDPLSAVVTKYVGYLESAQDATLARSAAPRSSTTTPTPAPTTASPRS